jgi:AraC family transcriptional regulator
VRSIEHLSNTNPSRASTLTANSVTVERVIQAMYAHVSDPLSLDEMAEIACLSPFHFNRMFRALIGIPPGEFFAALRLDAAKRLLLTTSLSVTDVCFDLGYSSLGTFVTRFKQLIGLSPLQLRQLADVVVPRGIGSFPDGSREAQGLAVLSNYGVSGTITAPGPFTGLIFAGLFPKPISQGRPIACVTLAAPGRYHIASVPDGRYYLLGAAVPRSPDALSYLLPGAVMLVGVAERPVLVHGDRASGPVDLALRTRRAADPPILGVFPPLLAAPVASRERQLA